MSIEAIVDEFFKAIEQGDVETLNRLYADDAGVWHNFDDITQTKAEGIQTLTQFAAVADARYELEKRHVVGDTVIQRHRIHVRIKETGATNIIPVAIFLTVRDGKVTHIHEYLDGTQVIPEAFEGVAGKAAA